jgi:hypothetical protein
VTFGRGARVTAGDREIELTLVRWGPPDATTSVEAPTWARGDCAASGAVDATGECVRRLGGRRDGLVGWFENTPSGMKHGYTVEIADADVEEDGAALYPDGGGDPLHYVGLVVTDADGVVLPAAMRAAPGGLRIEVDTRGARFPVEVDPTIVDRW